MKKANAGDADAKSSYVLISSTCVCRGTFFSVLPVLLFVSNFPSSRCLLLLPQHDGAVVFLYSPGRDRDCIVLPQSLSSSMDSVFCDATVRVVTVS